MNILLGLFLFNIIVSYDPSEYSEIEGFNEDNNYEYIFYSDYYEYPYNNITEVECSLETNTNNDCIKIEDNSEYFINQCNKKNNEICYLPGINENNTKTIKCGEFKKFNGDFCLADGECFSNQCVWGLCDAKKNGDNCTYNYECGVQSYCYNGKCTEYILREGDSCKTGKCSPEFFCSNRTKTCFKKAILDDGEFADDERLCKSFKLAEEGNCTSEYDNTTEADIKRRFLSKAFENFDWNKIKLSNIDSENVGNLEYLKYFWYKYLKDFEVTKQTGRCMVIPLKESFLLGPNSKYALDSDDTLRFLEIPKNKNKTKWYILFFDWIRKYAWVSLVLFGWLFLFLVFINTVIIYYCCCFVKPEVDDDGEKKDKLEEEAKVFVDSEEIFRKINSEIS